MVPGRATQMCLAVPSDLSKKDMKAAALSGVCCCIKAKHGTADCSYITIALMLTNEGFAKGGLKDSAISLHRQLPDGEEIP